MRGPRLCPPSPWGPGCRGSGEEIVSSYHEITIPTSCSVSSLGWVCARESQKVATLSQDTRAVTSSAETRVVMNTSTTLHLQCSVDIRAVNETQHKVMKLKQSNWRSSQIWIWCGALPWPYLHDKLQRYLQSVQKFSFGTAYSVFMWLNTLYQQISVASKQHKSTTQQTMENHLKSVHKSRKFPCMDCEYMATTKGSLRAHMESVHQGQKFPCTLCGSMFTQKQSLQTHINSVHKGQKFPCTHCGSTFSTKGNLQAHMKSVHDGQKFPCPHCPHKATQKVHLQTHIKSVHESQKLPCPRCDYKATEKGNLQKHIKTVHEGRRFTCLKCEYRSTKNTLLKKHEKSVHGADKLQQDLKTEYLLADNLTWQWIKILKDTSESCPWMSNVSIKINIKHVEID